MIHGTEYRYRRGCRCEDCARGHREARRREREKLLTGVVDAAPVRAHVAEQMGRGYTKTAVGKAAGVKLLTVSRLMSGESDTIRVTAAEKLLAVDLPDNLKRARDCTKHPVCCALCEDLEWLLTNGETLPIVAMRLGLTEDTAAHHIRRYLPGLRVAS